MAEDCNPSSNGSGQPRVNLGAQLPRTSHVKWRRTSLLAALEKQGRLKTASQDSTRASDQLPENPPAGS